MSQSKSIGTKYYNQFNNGENLDQNLGDYTPNLVGNVGDRIKVIQQVAVWWISNSAVLQPFDILGNTLTRTTGSFITDGFIVNDDIELYDLGGAALIFTGRTIVSMTATEIIFSGAVVPTLSYDNARLYGKTPLTAGRFRYGLIENAEPTNYVSKIDGVAENAWGLAAITGAAQPMVSATGVNSWKEVNDSVTIQEIGTFPQVQNYAQSFEIIHVFTILPYYLDGELVNLQTNVAPLLFTSTNTLKYVFECRFNTSLSNPNGTKDIIVDDVLGSVGWYWESLNGNVNTYNIRSLQYINQDTLQPALQINSQQKTKVLFDITDTLAKFTAGTNVVVGISLLPDLVDYQQNNNTIDYNFLLDSKFTNVDQPAVASTIITNLVSTLNTPGEISVSFDVDYLLADEPRLENHYYVIWVATADDALTGATTNRVALRVDVKQYDYNPDVEDLIWIDEMLTFPHNVDDTDDVNAFDNNVGWIEDGFTIKVPFELNNDLFARLKVFKAHFGAYNPTTDDMFFLQTYNVNLASPTVILQAPLNPYEAFNVITTRGFKLVTGSQFNKAELITLGPALRGGTINVDQYQLLLGMKANFEEWIAQPDADTIFYDVNEPNDGLNKKASQYSLKEGYQIVVTIEADVDKGLSIPFFGLQAVQTNYKFLSQPHAYFDYDLDDEVTPLWAVVIQTFAESGANTSGVINTSENTKVVATFTPLAGFTALTNPYAIIRLNQSGGNILTIHELSSIRESEIGNALIPLVGESYTKLTDNGVTVVVECLIDGTLLDDTIDYDLSATLRDDATELGIETELGVLIETESGDIIIKE